MVPPAPAPVALHKRDGQARICSNRWWVVMCTAHNFLQFRELSARDLMVHPAFEQEPAALALILGMCL